MAFTFAGWRTWGPFAIPWFVSVIKGDKKKPTPEVEIIGVKDPDLLHRTSSGTAITETTFDVTTRPDEARILFTNASGVAQVLTGCYVRGKVIKKVGGSSGYCNDKHVNYEAIARDGESKFELGNDYICTITQVNKLADWHWKLNKTKKHIYTVSLNGFQSYFEPGEWYVLTIGSAGTAEYIDSTVECYSVRCAYDAKGSMGTQVSFREVEENWKFDSNAVARYVAAGGHGRAPQGNIVTVAASGFGGYADYYCDGVNDGVEINSAISAIVSNDGGVVRFTRGTFNSSSLVAQSNVTLLGESGGTIINFNTTGNGIDITGSSSDPISNFEIENIRLEENTTNYCNLIMCDWTNGVKVSNCYLYGDWYNGITSQNTNYKVTLLYNTVDANNSASWKGSSPFGVVITANQCFAQGNEIKNITTTDAVNIVGMSIDTGIPGGIFVGNNYIHDLSSKSSSTSASVRGLVVIGDESIIDNNKIQDISSTGIPSLAKGLRIIGTRILVNNNYIKNCGASTGIINTTDYCLFYDSGTDTKVG